MIVLETRPHPSLPGGPVCVGPGLIAAETSNTAVNPHIFSCSVKENGDIKTNETLRQAGLVPSPDIGPKIILPGLTVTSHGATERADVFLHRAGRQKSGESKHSQTANAISHSQAAGASRSGEKNYKHSSHSPRPGCPLSPGIKTRIGLKAGRGAVIKDDPNILYWTGGWRKINKNVIF